MLYYHPTETSNQYSYEFQYGVTWLIWSHCVLVTEMSRWRWPDYWPKHGWKCQ